MSLTDQLASALRTARAAAAYADSGEVDLPGIGEEWMIAAETALRVYDACPKSEVKSNRAWREECQQLRAIIERLALIPAPDFYKSGDYAAGLINDAWREARDITGN